MCFVNYHGSIVLSEIIDVDSVCEQLKEGIEGCIPIVNHKNDIIEMVIDGEGIYHEDIIFDLLDEITSATELGAILYQDQSGTKWKQYYTPRYKEWIEENTDFARSRNGKSMKEKFELMQLCFQEFTKEEVVFNPQVELIHHITSKEHTNGT